MRRRRTAAIGFAATLALAACAGSDEPTIDAGADEPAAAPSTSDDQPATDSGGAGGEESSPADDVLTIADIDVPDVEVLSVPSGETVNVAEIALGQDTLFWFYAPH